MTADYRTTVCTELQKLEEDMLYTEKAHFAAAEELKRVHLWVGLIATVASAASVASIVAHGPAVIAGVLSLVAALASAIVTFVKPEKKAEQHLAAAKALGSLRVKARHHREIDLHLDRPEDVNVWRGLVKQIAEAKGKTDGVAPSLSDRRFLQARKKIQAGHFEHDSVSAAGRADRSPSGTAE
jgi:hypothetical protein